MLRDSESVSLHRHTRCHHLQEYTDLNKNNSRNFFLANQNYLLSQKCSVLSVPPVFLAPQFAYAIVLLHILSLAQGFMLQAFSMSRPSRTDMAKLVLIGNLGGDPETRSGKNDVPFVTYV